MSGSKSSKGRGRTNVKGADAFAPTRPNVESEQRTEATRPVNAGTGRHRGDRRDMSKTYTGNEKHAAHGNSPRRDVKTRKR